MYRRIKKVQLLINLADEIESMIRYKAMTVSDMIYEISINNSYSSLDFIKELVSMSENEADIHKAWSEAVKKSAFGNEEREIMFLFGNMLGTSDINGQVSAIELYKKRLDNLFNELKTEYESKGRMYRSGGVLIGIMAGILLV